MSADFTPNFSNIEKQGGFRFWCQKVLPLVYDDSLSYYELLCKVVNYLNNIIKDLGTISDEHRNLYNAFVNLQDYVNHYFDNLDVQNEINAKLDSMVNDGTLESIINNQIFGNINTEIDALKHNETFTMSNDEFTLFKNDMLKCVASYLVHSVGSECVIGTPVNIDTPFYGVYSNGNTYMGLLGQGTINFADKQFYNGVEYPVLYLDCSGLLSLLTKCRDYLNSPYYAAFNGTTDEATLKNLCREMGTRANKNYTMDFLNRITTFDMAYMLDKTGTPLRMISTYNGNMLNINSENYKYLQTGDLLFFGTNTLTGRYKGMHHCGLYIKTLEELNVFGETYGVTFNALTIENDNAEYGYVVDCGGIFGTSPNAIKITTLYANMVRTNSESVYYVHPVSNAFNSTKCRSILTGELNDYNGVVYSGRGMEAYANGFGRNDVYFNFGKREMFVPLLNCSSLGMQYIQLKSGTDVDTLDNSCYHCDTVQIASSLLNSPFDDRPFVILTFGVYQGGTDNARYGVQLAFSQGSGADASDVFKIRKRGYSGGWSSWITVSTSVV